MSPESYPAMAAQLHTCMHMQEMEIDDAPAAAAKRRRRRHAAACVPPSCAPVPDYTHDGNKHSLVGARIPVASVTAPPGR